MSDIIKDAVTLLQTYGYKVEAPDAKTEAHKKMTKDEILAIKDPTERQRAIAANLDKFGYKFNYE